MKRLAVLGQPIAHSLSPAMHTAAFAALGMDRDWSYEAIELSPEGFAAGVVGLAERGFVGANVTVPHKPAALTLADHATGAASAIGAANTLSFDRDGIRAENTDAPGLIAALPEPPIGKRALVLGAGGAARAAVWALAREGADVSIRNRTASRAIELAAALDVEALDSPRPLRLGDYELVVNATSIGLATGGAVARSQGSDLKALGVEVDEFSDPMVVVDLVYGAAPTELITAARRGGATVVDGLEVLVRQGAESFRIWTGTDPPLEVMRAAIRSEKQ